jgi:hypothetical protein
MGRYDAYKPDQRPGARDYTTKVPNFMDQVGTDFDDLLNGSPSLALGMLRLPYQGSDPTPPAGQGIVYTKVISGQIMAFYVAPGVGPYRLLAPTPRLVTSWAFYSSDIYLPQVTSVGPFQALDLPYANGTRTGFQEPVLLPGLPHRLLLDLAMSTTQAANLILNVAYKVISASDSLSLTTDLWRASWTPGASKKIVALASDGWREYTAGASGTTGSNAPTWPTSGTVADNTVTWTAGAIVYKNLALTYAVTASANQRFRVNSSSLQVPANEITSADQLLAGFVQRVVGSGHTGDLLLLDGLFQAVEA